MRIKVAVAIIGFAVLPVAQGHAQNERAQATSCARFAKTFYAWYVPLTQRDSDSPPSVIALGKKPFVFSQLLLKALREDDEAQRKASGEIVGIDFDPFVGGQDPADRYEVRHPSIKGKRCFVEVWRDSPRDTAAKATHPDAIAELSPHASGWQFEDFTYPGTKSSLVALLASLRQQRARQVR